MIRAIIIAIYLIIVICLIWWSNKITRDIKKIFATLSYQINDYFFIINNYIANNKDNLEKFDELIDVIYAKKKWFINNKTHTVAEWYELFLGLKSDINYLSDYTGDELSDNALDKKTENLFSFLFSIKPRQRVLRFVLGIITLGIGLGFVEEGVKL